MAVASVDCHALFAARVCVDRFELAAGIKHLRNTLRRMASKQAADPDAAQRSPPTLTACAPFAPQMSPFVHTFSLCGVVSLIKCILPVKIVKCWRCPTFKLMALCGMMAEPGDGRCFVRGQRGDWHKLPQPRRQESKQQVSQAGNNATYCTWKKRGRNNKPFLTVVCLMCLITRRARGQWYASNRAKGAPHAVASTAVHTMSW